jgi:hypothetical protein
MNAALLNLSERIHDELQEIDRVIHRAQTKWKQFQLTQDDAYLDSAALNLHGFYEGLERLFLLIALTVDEKRPQGQEWHQELLIQMREDRRGVRPAVIAAETALALDEFRGFRHVVRHIYTFSLDPHQVGELMTNVQPTFERVQNELETFADFLEDRAR